MHKVRQPTADFLDIEKIQCMHHEECTYFYNTCEDCLLSLQKFWLLGCRPYLQTDSLVQTKVTLLYSRRHWQGHSSSITYVMQST